MNYLDLLKVVKDRTTVEKSISRFESTEGIRLPPLYKAFISTFETSLINTAELLSYYHPASQAQRQLYRAEFSPNDQVSLDAFFQLDEAINTRAKLYAKEEDYLRNNFLPIGESFDQGILMLGILDENLDQIFVEHAFTEVRVEKVSENIFAFLQDFSFTLEASFFPKGKTEEDLYKNWQEDFWRLRE